VSTTPAQPAPPTPAPKRTAPGTLRAIVFVLALVAFAGPWGRTDLALLAGIVLALCGLSAFPAQSKAASRTLIQACVVMLGLRLDLATLAQAAMDGLALAVGTILGALALGLLLGHLLRSGREVSLLVSSGTAICGGSAIAAVGASIGAASASMAVATGAIFILNAVGLWTLPPIGHALNLSQTQFGVWAGVALHDIASVGGAAKSFGPDALDTANVVKLTRVLWIAPIAIIAGRCLCPPTTHGATPGTPRASASPFPWFILLFLVASLLRTLVPDLQRIEGEVRSVSGVGFQAALFLIGAGLSREALRRVGWRALVQASVLWIIVAGASLACVVWLV
jgi:uncharacterized integral membrane protein (TIGR00698 family)